MGGVECVLPNKDSSSNNIRAFNSLVSALLIAEKVAVARYVKKNNSAPKLVVLMPERE